MFVQSVEDVLTELFEEHERQWIRLHSLGALDWQSFPWPLFTSPRGPDDLTPSAIRTYIQWPQHALDERRVRRNRIKKHIRRWHHDFFETTLLPKVREDDRERIMAGRATVVSVALSLLRSQ
ncbi:hypothetical protein OBBRIDRAFT_725095, partial [Obba rivulosa]